MYHFLDEGGHFENPDALFQPETLMPLLKSIQSIYLQNLFYSSGLYRAIPESIVDEAFSLPYPVILWLCSWSDENRERSAQFHTREFTRMCVQRCRANLTSISIAHLAVLCNCQPAEEWTRCLAETLEDFLQPLYFDATTQTHQLVRLAEVCSGLSVHQFNLILEIFLSVRTSITPAGLAALMGNCSALEHLLSYQVKLLIVLIFFIHNFSQGPNKNTIFYMFSARSEKDSYTMLRKNRYVLVQ